MAQFGLQNFVGWNNQADPANTNVTVATGTGASDGEYLVDVPAGGKGLVITMVAYSVTVAEDTTAQVLKFWRRITAGSATGQRAVTFNAGDGTGATTATIPITQAIGDCYRIYFGQDTNEDHVLNPGESFAVELDVTGTGQAATGVLTVHGYSFDVGAGIPIVGGSTGLTGDQTKPNANGTGNIVNLIA